jgi:hypothetical protein
VDYVEKTCSQFWGGILQWVGDQRENAEDELIPTYHLTPKSWDMFRGQAFWLELKVVQLASLVLMPGLD